MKTYISLIIALSAGLLSAQQSQKVLYCNEYQNVALVMGAPIAQAVTGAENFVFSYNQTATDSLGLLQGRPGRDSNLLIRTTDGALYSYRLKYRDSLSSYVHFINPESRINPLPEPPVMTKIAAPKNNLHSGDDYYEKLSRFYFNRTPVRLAGGKKDRLKLELQGVYYYREEVFLVLRIKNRSEIDFRVNDLSVSKVHGIKGRKSSFQKLVLKDRYRENFPHLVRHGSESRFVMVFPKFTLGDHEKLQFVLSEAGGSRYIKLVLD